MCDFSFGMYALVWLYLCCTALSAVVAAQHFWNEDEFCRNLNSRFANQSLVHGVTNFTTTNITCVQFNNSQSNKGNTNFLNNVRLLCREFNALTYTWDNMNSDIVIIAEFMSYDSTDMHIIKETNLAYIDFNDLKSSTEYVARFRTLINGTSNHTTDTPVQATLEITRKPDPVKNVRISHFDTSENPNIKALLTWEPSIDMNCNYKIIHQSETMDSVRLFEKINVSYAVVLNSLRLNTKYGLFMKSYYFHGSIMKSNETFLGFVTPPTCLEVNKNDVNSCSPRDPLNVTVTETPRDDGGRYDARVNWTSPDGGGCGVDYFAVSLHVYAANVSGAESAARFDNVSLPSFFYVSVQAFSRTGKSARVRWRTDRSRSAGDDDDDDDDAGGYPWTVVALLALMVSCVAAAVAQACGWRRRCGRPRSAAASGPYATAAGRDRCYDVVAALGKGGLVLQRGRDDACDALLDRDDVVVSDELLGRGHFGVVRRGVVRTDRGDRPVAVKSLREHATGRELEQFVGEILLMYKVGEHPNIVAMVGCCLDADARCLLVVEYCALGDLQTYLRRVSFKSWYANGFYVGQTKSARVPAVNSKEVELLDAGSPLQTADEMMTSPMVFNNCYLYHSEENVFLTIDDLMLFASQAANGMAFLEKNHIVHRDLAARNLLLSDHHTVKICDFGLSRDVYEQNLYQNSNRGDPVPVKWMALESLKYRVYTTQSDVWSFGVLLWEIMMLGGSPYPTISSSKIYEVLSRGYRMPRPTLCCYSLYELMLACWHSNPANRPKFDSIKETIDKIIENQYS